MCHLSLPFLTLASHHRVSGRIVLAGANHITLVASSASADKTLACQNYISYDDVLFL